MNSRTTGRSILTRQEADEAILLLAAQRGFYSRAKGFLSLQMLLSVVTPAIFSIAALTIDQTIRPWAALVSMLVLTIDVTYLESRIRVLRQMGAATQEEFDCLVYGLEWPQWRIPKPDRDLIAESGHAILEKPEMKKWLSGWYPKVIGHVEDSRAILLCQRYNLSYGLRIRRNVTVWLWFVVILGFSVLIGITLYKELKLADALLAFGVPMMPILSWTWREHVRQRDFIAAQERVKSAIERVVEAPMSDDSQVMLAARRLQDEIHAQRHSDPLIFDWVYWLMRDKSEQSTESGLEAFMVRAGLIKKAN